MAIQINDPNYRGPGAQAGEALGQSLAAPLQMLAQRKMQEIHDRYQQREALKKFSSMGYAPHESQILSMFQNNPKELSEMMNNMGIPQGQQQANPDQLASMFQQLSTARQPSQGQPSYAQVATDGRQQPQQPAPSGYAPVYQPQQQTYPTPQQAPQPGQVPGRRYGGRTEQARSTAEMKHIYGQNDKFNEELDKSADDDRLMKMRAEEALQLLDKGTTRSGVAGMLPLGLTMANEDTRVLDKIYAELASSVASKGTGPLSRARIKLAERQKPSLDMPVEGQRQLLQRIIEQADNRGLAMEGIRDRVLEENGYGAIPGLRQRVLNEWKANYLGKEGEGGEISREGGGQKPQDQNVLLWAARQGVSGVANYASGAIGGLGDIAGAGLGLANYITGGKISGLSKAKNICLVHRT
jgi:hypothetical protein